MKPKRTLLRRLLYPSAALFCASLAAAEPPPAPPEPQPTAEAEAEIFVPSPAQLNADPIGASEYLMELTGKAEAAEKGQDLLGAVRYYTAITKMVDDRALPFGKLCALQQALGKRERALIACHRAISLEGVKLEDFLRYLSLLLNTAEGQPMMPKEVAEADAVLANLETQQLEGVAAEMFMCQLGIKLGEAERVRSCLAKLDAKHATAAQVVPFEFTLALLEQNYERGAQLIQKAQGAALPPEAIEMMRDELRRQRGGISGRALLALGLLGVAAGGSGWLWVRRRRSLAAAAAGSSSGSSSSVEAPQQS